MRVNPANGDHTAVAIDFPFDKPWAVALDAVGNAIVTDPGGFTGRSRLIRVDIGVGGSFPSIRADIPGVFTGVAVEPTGHLIVTDEGDWVDQQKLLRFLPTSGPPTVVSQGNKFRSLVAVAVEANGAILVADRPGAIFRVDPATGAQSTVSVGGSLRGFLGLAVRR
jgi:hypothetical protein